MARSAARFAALAAAVAVVVALLFAAAPAPALAARAALAVDPVPELAALEVYTDAEVFNPPKEVGLPKAESAVMTKALAHPVSESTAGSGTEAEHHSLAEMSEHFLHFIHKAHLGVEFAEIARHKAHEKHAVEQITNAFKLQVEAIRATVPQYAEAFRTSETFVAIKRTRDDALAVLKNAQRRAKLTPKAIKQLQAAADAASAELQRASPAMRRAVTVLQSMCRSIVEVKKAWFLRAEPVLAALRSGAGAEAAALSTKVTASLKSFQQSALPVVTAASRLGGKAARLAVNTLKFATSAKFAHYVLYFGVAMETVNGALTSKASTTPGLIIDAVLKGGVGYIVMRNPAVALLDMVLPDQLKLSTTLKGVAEVYVAIGELVFAGNPTMLERVNAANLNGENGYLLNLAAALGEQLAGNSRALQQLNEKNLSGKNGAVLHLASGYGELIFNGNPQPLAKYQEMALKGEHGKVAYALAWTGEKINSWIERGFRTPVAEVYAKVVPRPTGDGTYWKIKSCTASAVAEATNGKPAWDCAPSDTPRRPSHTSNAGRRSGGVFLWDIQKDASKAGFGLFWRKADTGGQVTRCITCTLRDVISVTDLTLRAGVDRTFPNTKLSICDKGTSVFAPNDVLKNGRKVGTCEAYVSRN